MCKVMTTGEKADGVIGVWLLGRDTIEAFYVYVVLFANDGSIKELEKCLCVEEVEYSN